MTVFIVFEYDPDEGNQIWSVHATESDANREKLLAEQQRGFTAEYEVIEYQVQ